MIFITLVKQQVMMNWCLATRHYYDSLQIADVLQSPLQVELWASFGLMCLIYFFSNNAGKWLHGSQSVSFTNFLEIINGKIWIILIRK